MPSAAPSSRMKAGSREKRPIMAGVTRFSKLIFKAKTAHHTERKTKSPKAVQVDPEVLTAASDFAKAYVTEARCLKGVEQVGKDVRATGDFLRWINGDILNESAADLEASGLTWKDVAKTVNRVASNWYLSHVRGF